LPPPASPPPPPRPRPPPPRGACTHIREQPVTPLRPSAPPLCRRARRPSTAASPPATPHAYSPAAFWATPTGAPPASDAVARTVPANRRDTPPLLAPRRRNCPRASRGRPMPPPPPPLPHGLRPSTPPQPGGPQLRQAPTPPSLAAVKAWPTSRGLAPGLADWPRSGARRALRVLRAASCAAARRAAGAARVRRAGGGPAAAVRRPIPQRPSGIFRHSDRRRTAAPRCSRATALPRPHRPPPSRAPRPVPGSQPARRGTARRGRDCCNQTRTQAVGPPAAPPRPAGRPARPVSAPGGAGAAPGPRGAAARQQRARRAARRSGARRGAAATAAAASARSGVRHA
jgi:hypothetical protein